MTQKFIAACLQMNAGDQVAANLRRARELLQQAVDQGAKLVALPEYFPLLAADETHKLRIAEQDNDGPIQDFLATAAQQHSIYLVGGALPIDAGHGRVYSACPLYAPNGQRLARYDKMHLFRFAGRQDQADETTTIIPGHTPVAVDTMLGRIGLCVCYDLRFPELFRAMQNPDIIVAPSAFTRETGGAHWEVLLRARAIENIAHLLAPAQAGTHPGRRRTFGHSMIIDSWGCILAQANDHGDAVITATIDGDERTEQRARLPALNHRLLT